MPRFNEANKTSLGSARRSVLEKQFDRADTVRDARLTLPAQPVDATPSNQLVRQYFPMENPTVGWNQLNLARVVFRLV
jgi:hypothetical protein